MARVPSGEDQYLTPNSCWGERSFFSAMGASPAPCFILKYENQQDRFGAKAMAAARILIVEDERLIAIDLQRRLTRLGYTVVALAASGIEAVQKVLTLHPDVVLMDIRLQGDMDGVEAAQRIHASTPIPVVFMTAYVDEDTQQRMRATSPWDCLYKPFAPHQVQSVLEHVLSVHPPDTL
jgi:CheY-like chemotaxis protein